jgi:phospholipid/cholesterol/gamma-HCH transport system permease protein
MGTLNHDSAEVKTACGLEFARPTRERLVVRLSGNWRVGAGLPGPGEFQKQLDAHPELRAMAFDSERLTDWDTALCTFLAKVMAENERRRISTDPGGLPAGVRRLLALASAVPRRKDAQGEHHAPSWLARIGMATASAGREATGMLAFLGNVCLCLPRLFLGRARFRRVDFLMILQECGAQALPIVTLISFLVGVILAYVGSMQLRQFGAQVYVADLVGIAMTREMGAMMTAIIMAGRTGAAFAAELGTMQVNEEIDALSTLGIRPIEFLVLPRMLALAVMMPLLCLYADLMGILGGAAVGLGMLDLGAVQYYLRTAAAVSLDDVAAGLIKGGVFGVLVAIAGCLRGMACGRSSAAVGWAATSAVVTAIVSIIVSDAVMTVVFDLLGF